MSKEQSMFAFIINPHGPNIGEQEQIHLVMANDFAQAMDRVKKSRAEKVYAYKMCGSFTKEQLNEFLKVECLDPLNTGAALRYAAMQYEKTLTKTQIRHLRDSARVIERSFLELDS